MADNKLLRTIPKVDALLSHPMLQEHHGAVLTDATRAVIDTLRKGVLSGAVNALPSEEELCRQILTVLGQSAKPSLRPVLNATGVILHTNLGRAPLCSTAMQSVAAIASAYNTLEYDLETGGRGSRHSHVEELLCKITGAEAALAVNNNAAAVLLVLSAMTKGKEVPISRGELVEIGGSFRVPEVMEQGGAILREVGTTNKTHLADYEGVINEHTGALLKVHTSNYRIVGFTESVSLADLTALAHQHNIPVIEDLGSGLLIHPEQLNVGDEPYVMASVAAGVDVITFSGDKLLGGPQAGIIIGKQQYIESIKRHPLARAMRIDKLTLAALEATLRCYCDMELAKVQIPIIRMLTTPEKELEGKARALQQQCVSKNISCKVVPDSGQVGGGSVPQREIPSFAVAVNCPSPTTLESNLRKAALPVIAHINKGKLLLNVLTLGEEEFPQVAQAVAEALEVSQ